MAPVDVDLVAVVSGVLAAGGVVLAVAAVIGTTRPPGPPSAPARLLLRLWRGGGTSRREQRAHQALLAVAAVLGAFGWLLTGLPVIGLLIAVAVPGAPWLFAVGRAERRTIARIEAVGEWTRRLKDVSTTGQGLQQAIVSTVATAPDEIGEEVRTLAARLRAGWPPRTALLCFADELGDPVADQVVAALVLHLADRGERMSEVLGAIAHGAALEVATRREVDAKRTQPRFAVRFLTGMTLLILVFGLVNPSYMRPYATPTGQVMMATLGTAFVALLVWVRNMSQPPRPVRFLAPPLIPEAAP